MAPTVHASSPPRVEAATSAPSVTTAAFTAPAGSLLVAAVLIDAGAAPAPTLTMSNSGTALTWTKVAEQVTGGAVGSAIFVAPAPVSASRTVTFTTSNSDNKSLKVDVVQGHDTTTPTGDVTSGNVSTNTVTIPGLVATRANSLGFYAAAQDESSAAATTSGETVFEPVFISGQVAGGSGYKPMGAVGAEITYTIDAAGTTVCDWHYVGVEILSGVVEAAAPIVEVVVEPAPLSAAKSAAAAPVEVGVEALPVTVAHQVSLDATDVVVEVLGVAVELRPPQPYPDYVDVVVESTPLAVAHVVPAVPVEVAVEPMPVGVAHVAAVAPVEVTVEPTPVTVVKYATAAVVEAVVEVLPVSVAHVVPVGAVDVVVEVRPSSAGGTSAARVDVVVEILPVTVSYGGTGVSRRGFPPVITQPTTRVIAQSILDGRWLHWDLPVRGLEITWALSGPTVISGFFEPEIEDLRDLDLQAHGTWLHVEDSGLIRASGILQPGQADDQKLTVEALGPSHYARKVPYRGAFSQIGVDPADIVRHLWAHIQMYPTGNLGVQVHGSTPVRLGTEPSEQVDFVTGGGEQVSFDRGGPYQLNWFELTMCGAEIDNLAGETPFDYVERAQWNSTKTAVEHHIDIGYPMIGRRRTDLRFADGENILESAPIEETDGIYADEVFVQGKGEGQSSVTGYAGIVVPGRLRMPVVVVDKTIPSKDRADARAREELAARLSALIEISEIAVRADHHNAPLGSYGPGDEVQPQLVLPHVGAVRPWHRCVGVRYVAEDNAAVLALTRRGEFASR